MPIPPERATVPTHPPKRVMPPFPNMPFGVTEIAVIAPPEHLLRWLQNDATRCHDPTQNVINTSPIPRIVAQGQGPAPQLRHVDPDIFGQLL